MDDRFERPHRDTTGYMMRAYAKMVYLRDLISRDKLNEYYQKCIGLARARGDMAEIYSTSARYYQCTGDYERAVAYIDSNRLQKQRHKSGLSPYLCHPILSVRKNGRL